MKKLLCFLLSLILVLSGCTVVSGADLYSGTIGDNVSWSINNNGRLTISGTGDLPDSNISSWISYKDAITSVVINKNLTAIGDNCFNALESVKSFTIADTVKDIKYNSFANCTSLGSIYLPMDLEYIDNSFVNGCTNLETINISSDNEYFSSYDGVLYNSDITVLYRYPPAKEGENFEIPDTVKVIGDNAFADNVNLKSITVPETLESFSDNAFDYDSDISIEIKNDIEKHTLHEFTTTIVKPTCFSKGYTLHKCVICSEEFIDSYTPALDHVIKYYDEVPRSCINSGLSGGYYCTLCGTVFVARKVTAPIDHVYVNGICTMCGKSNIITTVTTVKTTAATSSKTTSKKPGTVKVKKVSKLKKGFKINWKKLSNISGYQIMYAKNKKFTKGKKTITIKSNKTTTKSVKKLKRKTTYYVKIRAYKTQKDKKTGKSKKVYGKWSKVYKVKTK